MTAVLLGVGFGFVLEKAGFGNAKTLAGQWYGYNFAVLRVMFTAIVVAMLGLFGLHYLGVLDLSAGVVNETFLWPQLIGGLIFGVRLRHRAVLPGHGAGGVRHRQVRRDGLPGRLLRRGLVAFFFAFPLRCEGFYDSSAMGRVLLPDALDLPAGVVVLGVVLMALGAFALTHVLDRRFGNEGRPEALSSRRRPAGCIVPDRGVALRGGGAARRRRGAGAVPSRRAAAAGEVRGGSGSRADGDAARSSRTWGIEGRRDYVVVDLRPHDDFDEGHIRGAVSCGTCHADEGGGRRPSRASSFVDLTKKLVLYTETGTESVKLPKLLAQNPRAGAAGRAATTGGSRRCWRRWRSAARRARRSCRRSRSARRCAPSTPGERPASGNAAMLPMAPISGRARTRRPQGRRRAAERRPATGIDRARPERIHPVHPEPVEGLPNIGPPAAARVRVVSGASADARSVAPGPALARRDRRAGAALQLLGAGGALRSERLGGAGARPLDAVRAATRTWWASSPRTRTSAARPATSATRRAADAGVAHRGLVRIPGNLSDVAKTCGAVGCHPEMPARLEHNDR